MTLFTLWDMVLSSFFTQQELATYQVGSRNIHLGSNLHHVLSHMDEVQAKRETVVITKHGKPGVKLVPVGKATGEIYNFLRGKGAVTGNVISPAIENWGVLKLFSSTRMRSSGWRSTQAGFPQGNLRDRQCA
jgi:antitoxin (DNA-binding transcriptional repressor) of toxin-antitoxin stability system